MRHLVLIILFVTLTMSPVSSIAETIVVKPRGNTGPRTVADWKLDWPNCEYEDGIKEGHLSVVSVILVWFNVEDVKICDMLTTNDHMNWPRFERFKTADCAAELE